MGNCAGPALAMSYPAEKGQDKWVDAVLKGKRDGYFVDIGSAHPILNNNSYFFEDERGWDGICCDVRYFEEACRRRRCKVVNAVCGDQSGLVTMNMNGDLSMVNTVHKTQHWVMQVTLLQLLAINHAPAVMDFLSLDCEGYEMRVMKSFPFDQYKFRTVIIEWPSRELDELMFENGYYHGGMCGKDRCYYNGSLVKLADIHDKSDYEPLPPRSTHV